MIDNEIIEPGADDQVISKWAPVLEGIEDNYFRELPPNF
jgi:hypothetical protein